MAVRVRKYKDGNGWEVDIQVALPDGRRMRQRRLAPVSSKSAAMRWGEARARELAIHGPSKPRKEVPTLAAFEDRFIEAHCEANRHKPSGIESKRSAFRNYLVPILGPKKLDAISHEEIALVKRKMVTKQPATVNNVLTTLSQALKCALEWGVIDKMPAKVRLLKTQKGLPRFYDFEEFEWLVDAARKIDQRILVMLLLGGEAGLRRGEIIALEQTDCDLRRGLLKVERSEWNGHVTPTKGMECRVVPMTKRLAAALREHKHLRGNRVLYADTIDTPTAKVIRKWMERAQKRAGLKETGGIHVLRHTFCSHLAMRGAPALSIQKLAGHKNLMTTLRYMHLSPGETDRAIRLLEGSSEPEQALGEIVETSGNVVQFPNRSS
jgi:integrase